MCGSHGTIESAQKDYLDALMDARLLVSSGVPGVYGLSGVFEGVLEAFGRYVTRMGAHLKPEAVRFPPVLSRKTYQCMDHMETFPNLMGSVHSFLGKEKEHVELVRKKTTGEDWTQDLQPTDVMMAPASCYPLYPTAAGKLPENGRLVELGSFVFRHEPSYDPARMQIFRMREFVRLGTPTQALEHRDYWLKRGEEMLKAVGLNVTPVVANDPFFGRGGRVMVATQREQALKYELVVPITSEEKPTAVASSNYHMDHFSETFDIRTADGERAHTACVGFGLERVTLALFKTHGFDVARWPADVRNVLELC